MQRRTLQDARIDKQKSIANAERDGMVADSLEVRKALLAKVQSGQMTLVQAQAELKLIKRNAKRNGLITRTQAWRRG